MKKWKSLIIIIAVILVVFIVGIEFAYNTFVTDCCSCCDDGQMCISVCCPCNYNIFEKTAVLIDRIF